MSYKIKNKHIYNKNKRYESITKLHRFDCQ